jgi:putative SOS response-associated peptidase YedK
MCGRFTRATNTALIAKEFDVDEVSDDLGPSYNIAPTQEVAVIVSDGKKQLVKVRWGLVPSWAKELSVGNKMINARAETITEKASFKRAFKKRRCLIVADGFYEWQKIGDTKRPIYIRLKSRKPFGFAGIYENWESEQGKQIVTCAIITTAANALMKPIHDRMPVILPKENENPWLDPRTDDQVLLLEMLQPYPADAMEAYPVSKRVNIPSNNSPECINPVS